MLEMSPDLMGPSGFKYAFNDIYISETFQHTVVGDGVFAVFTAFGKNAHDFPVGKIPADIADDRTVIFF